MSVKLLFVCTGNICRSPMAEAMAVKLFGDFVQAGSAGLAAFPGQSASDYALEVLNEQGIDFSGHSSRTMSAELAADADWIIPMTKDHAETLRRRFPECEHKIRCLGDWDGGNQDVDDPWGGSRETYRQALLEIEEHLGTLGKELFPTESGDFFRFRTS